MGLSMGKLKRFLPTVGLSLFVAYLAFHAFDAEEGYRSHLIIQARIAEVRSELEAVRQERADLEDQVARLSVQEGKLDLDYLEERARDVLNYAHPNEIVVKIDERDRTYYGQ